MTRDFRPHPQPPTRTQKSCPHTLQGPQSHSSLQNGRGAGGKPQSRRLSELEPGAGGGLRPDARPALWRAGEPTEAPDSQSSPEPWRRGPERPRVAQRLPSAGRVALVSRERGGPSGVRSRVTWWPGPRSALPAENWAAWCSETQLRGTRSYPVRGPCGLGSPRPLTGATTSPSAAGGLKEQNREDIGGGAPLPRRLGHL